MPYTSAEALLSRRDFPALQQRGQGPALAYLDGPGGSQVPDAVIEAMQDVYSTCNVNTHGNFPPSREIDRRMTRKLRKPFVGVFHGSGAPLLGSSSSPERRHRLGRRWTTLPPIARTLRHRAA